MYQLDNLKKIPGLVHAFSEIKEGNMSFNWGRSEGVLANRKKFFNAIGISEKNCITASLEHGTDIVVIGKLPSGGETPEADCLITKSKNVFLSILSADCLPVILYDGVNSVLALAHLSRINTPQDFLRKIIDKMKSEFKTEPENIIVGIGPGIHKESYIFTAEELHERVPDEEIFKGFILDLPDGPRSAEGYSGAGKKAVDLVGYNVKELISAGVPEKNVEISGIDTAADRNFFSHHRSILTGEPEGRMMTVVGMEA